MNPYSLPSLNLVTRCPACATMFKLVPDQLKIANGWVRCGQCSEVFEASLVPKHEAPPAALIPDADAPAAIDQPAAMPSPQTPETPSFSAFSQQGLVEKFVDMPDSATSLTPDFAQPLEDAPTPQGESVPRAPAPADEAVPQAVSQAAMEIQPDALPATLAAAMAAPQEPERIEPAFSGADPAFKPDSPPRAEPVGFSANAPDAPLLAAEPLELADELSFIRDAQRKAFWETPLVRTVLGLLFTLLLVALALQWTVRQKDVLAAQEPRLAPWLQALCRPLGCEVRPLRRIEAVQIDSANFSKSGPQAYRLTFVLKNTGAAALEIPALEVTLSDSQDQALVRRVLLPAQFGVTAATLQAHSELPGVVALTLVNDGDPAAALPVAGYRILAFYP